MELAINRTDRIFFTADTHFGHRNIIKYVARPFKSCREMDDALIENWNRVVHPSDIVFHLGDFVFGNKQYIIGVLKRLHGRIYLVPGNHDYPHLNVLELFVEVLPPIAIVKTDAGRFVLCHYPLLSWPGRDRGTIHLHGHMHKTVVDIPNMMNVGVDVCGYQPVPLKGILNVLKRRRQSDGP